MAKLYLLILVLNSSSLYALNSNVADFISQFIEFLGDNFQIIPSEIIPAYYDQEIPEN